MCVSLPKSVNLALLECARAVTVLAVMVVLPLLLLLRLQLSSLPLLLIVVVDHDHDAHIAACHAVMLPSLLVGSQRVGSAILHHKSQELSLTRRSREGLVCCFVGAHAQLWRMTVGEEGVDFEITSEFFLVFSWRDQILEASMGV